MGDRMTLPEFVELVRRMRAKQVEKDLERRVDAAIRELTTTPPLFGSDAETQP